MNETKLAFDEPDFNIENFSMYGIMTTSGGDNDNWDTDEF